MNNEKLRLALSLLVSVLIIWLSGCTTLKGRPSTDLSGLALGMPRENVDEIMGPPASLVSTKEGIVAEYSYDRGYVAPAEEGGTSASDVLMYGTLFVFSAGTIGLIGEDCFPECQKGILKVFFDNDNRLVGAVEQPGGGTGGCWDSHKRIDRCRYIFSSPRPSTLPESLRDAGNSLMSE